MILKNSMLLILCSIFISKIYGQSNTGLNQDSLGTFTKVDIEAAFSGGDRAWINFLKDNLNTNLLVEKNAPDGSYTVIVRFIVRADGSVTDVHCDNYPGYGMCEEGIRVIKKSKKWLPAQVNGKPVNAYRRQPITLEIQGR